MHGQLKHDLNELPALLELTKSQALDFLGNIEKIPTSVASRMPEMSWLSESGVGGMEALRQFQHRFKSIMVSSGGPRYWGFVTGGATPASIMGDWLAAAYDQNTQSVNGHGDVSARIELETIRLLLDLFGLPDDYLGGFVTGATMSNFTCLAVARQWLGKLMGYDAAREGVRSRMPVLSATPHSSAVKSLAMLGMGSGNYQHVQVLEGNREAVDVNDLERKIQELKGVPFIFISSAGTVNTADFDDFVAINKLRSRYNFWWHIDAAFGGFVACSPKYNHLVKGWEEADSITIDNHKWMNVPYENAFFLVKKQHRNLQIETFQNSNAPYLGDPLENFSYLNFLPENSRRLKALPVWFGLTAYGKNGYRSIVENSVAMANYFGNFIDHHDELELVAPVRLNNVCFTLKGAERQEHVMSFLARLNDTGKVFMTPTTYKGKKGIRASFVNWRTRVEDVERVIEEMKLILSNSEENQF